MCHHHVMPSPFPCDHNTVCQAFISSMALVHTVTCYASALQVSAVADRADAWMAIEFLNSRGARPEFGPVSGVTSDWSVEGRSAGLCVCVRCSG